MIRGSEPEDHEELIMYPYQIYQALADQRINDLIEEAHRHNLAADARRRQRMAAATSVSVHRTEHLSHSLNAIARVLALVHVPTGSATSDPGTRPTQSTTSTAGPMGCVA